MVFIFYEEAIGRNVYFSVKHDKNEGPNNYFFKNKSVSRTHVISNVVI